MSQMAEKIKKSLSLGQVVMTRGVEALMLENPEFGIIAGKYLYQHEHGDWGDVCDEDKAINDDAFKHGGRILSAYTIDPSKGKSEGFGDNTLWIITEWDRSVTTLLLPEEY
jgi:hypothetical protein